VKFLVAFLLFIVPWKSCLSQELNYEEIFGDDWKKAASFEKENRSWMEALIAQNHISYPLAISIIFPELIRYSALRNKIEITLLKTLYVNLGEEYANFSIGQFQMKPSFAEMIRRDAFPAMGLRPPIIFRKAGEYNDITEFRKSIIKDLEDIVSQVYYLIAFIKICDHSFSLTRKDELSNVKFLATTYNYGFEKNRAEIEKMTDKKFFNTRLLRSENYSYADVSVFWFKQFTSGNSIH